MTHLEIVFSDSPIQLDTLEKRAGDIRIVQRNDESEWKWDVWLASDNHQIWYRNDFRGGHKDSEEVFKTLLALMSYGAVRRVVLAETSFLDYFQYYFNQPVASYQIVSASIFRRTDVADSVSLSTGMTSGRGTGCWTYDKSGAKRPTFFLPF